MQSQAKTVHRKNHPYNRSNDCQGWCAMPKAAKDETMTFGQRLAQLRKAKGFTQQELANEVGITRRMVAYYESQSQHPPTTQLPAIARALKLSTDELLGTIAVKQRAARERDSRLERRLQQIEKLDAADKRQVLQLIDAFIERGQLKRKVQSKSA
jgi:transcriptional regulator with XRE-family HTH domain